VNIGIFDQFEPINVTLIRTENEIITSKTNKKYVTEGIQPPHTHTHTHTPKPKKVTLSKINTKTKRGVHASVWLVMSQKDKHNDIVIKLSDAYIFLFGNRQGHFQC
jgi:hypothetical protein